MGHRRERYCKWQRNLTEPSAAPADLGLAYDALSERRVRTNYSGIRPPSLHVRRRAGRTLRGWCGSPNLQASGSRLAKGEVFGATFDLACRKPRSKDRQDGQCLSR
jgi:hypothetical protein